MLSCETTSLGVEGRGTGFRGIKPIEVLFWTCFGKDFYSLSLLLPLSFPMIGGFRRVTVMPGSSSYF